MCSSDLIVMKLISLIMVVIVMRIAVNPKAKRVVAFAGLYEGKGNVENAKIPSYIDCGENNVTIYPGAKHVSWEELQRPGNPVDQLLDKVEAHSAEEYVVVMVRPKSLKYYRAIRNRIAKRTVDVGYDAVDADFRVNWDEATKALQVSED